MGVFRVSVNSTTDKPQISLESSSFTVVGTVAVPYTDSIISYVLPPLVVAYANSPYTWSIGSPVLEVPTLEGGIIAGCTVSPALPSGLILNTKTCAISGTPSAIKSQASYTIMASNVGGSTYAYILITVNDEATKSLSYSNVPINLTSKLPIQTITPVFTGGSPTYCTSTPALPIGLVLDRYTCSISGITNLSVNSRSYVIRGGNVTGYSEATITFGVIVEAPKSITYPNSSYRYTQLVSIPAITPVLTGGTPATCTTNPSLPAGISINSNCVIQGSSQGVSASQSYTVTATNATGSISSSVTLEFTILPPASLTYSGSFFTLSRGISFSLTPSIGGGIPDTCAITPALPTGMVINQNTCTISGTPASMQYNTVHTITASNSGGSAPSTTLTFLVYGTAFGLLKTGQTIAYTSGDDGDVLKSTSRGYADDPLGIITDTAMGLYWTKCELGQNPKNCEGTASTYTHANAITACSTLNLGGRIWRLPSIQELLSLTDLSMSSPALTGGFPKVVNGNYWTSTTYAKSTSSAWVVAMDTGSSSTLSKTSTGYVRCVTGPTLLPVPSQTAITQFTYGNSIYILEKNRPSITITPTLAGGSIQTCSVNPSLPQGLSISNSTCEITGSPSDSQLETSHTITVSNALSTRTTTLKFTVMQKSPYALKTGQTTSYSTRDDGDLKLGTSLNFTDDGKGTLTDSTTNLSWQKCDMGQTVKTCEGTSATYTYTNGVTACTNFNLGGKVWRVPTLQELSTLVDLGRSSPSLPSNFSRATSGTFWSNSTYSRDTSQVWTISFDTGSISTTSKTSSAYLRCVTGPKNVPVSSSLPPSLLSYGSSGFTYVISQGKPIGSMTPTLSGGPVTSCTSNPPLPNGLSINSTTCEITGTPTDPQLQTSYTITATGANNQGTSFSFSIAVQRNPLGLLKTGQTTSYTTGDDGDLKLSVNRGISIYNKGIIWDPSMGLYWHKCDLGKNTMNCIGTATTYTYSNASTACSALNLDGKVWRLPTVQELISITDLGVSSPALSPYFLLAGTGTYWTSTPYSRDTNQVWSVSLDTGSVSTTSKTSSAYVRCVTGVIVPAVSSNTAMSTLTYGTDTYVLNSGLPIADMLPLTAGGSITSCLSNPTLPTGLSLNNTTCEITGTPTDLQLKTKHTITVSSSGGSKSTDLYFTVVKNLLGLLKTGQSTSYTTGDDGGLQASNGILNSLTDSGSGTISSANTGLVWQKCGDGVNGISCLGILTTSNYTTASSTCSNLNLSGKSWRLPTLEELNSLVDLGRSSPAISPIFTMAGTGTFWTSSPYSRDTSQVWTISFDTGSISTTSKTSSAYTRCVTGPLALGSNTVAVAPTGVQFGNTSINLGQGLSMGTSIPALFGALPTSCSSNPPLPTGLTLNQSNCTLSGTPTTATGTTSYTITASNGQGSGVSSIPLQITVWKSPFALIKTGQTTSYTTGDDGNYQYSKSLTYSDTNLGMITESETGFRWQKCVWGQNAQSCSGTATASTYTNAQNYCSSLHLGARVWRVPTLQELNTLVDLGTSSPSLKTDFFPATPNSGFWTSTAYSRDATQNWIISFDTGSHTTSSKTSNNFVRCITGTGSGTEQFYSGAPLEVSYSLSSLFLSAGVNVDNYIPAIRGGSPNSCSASPPLPTGLNLAGNSCQISGTPTGFSPQGSYTITASNGSGIRTTTLGIGIWNKPLGLLRTGQNTSYTTGDDGNYKFTATRSFTDNGNGSITDNSTGLIWQKCTVGAGDPTCTGTATTSNYITANSACTALTLGGKTWRIPTIQELLTLVDLGRSSPAIVNTFTSIQSATYWTSTPYIRDTNQNWTIDFSTGSASTTAKNSTSLYTRCVTTP
jgi:hypothetical protein